MLKALKRPIGGLAITMAALLATTACASTTNTGSSGSGGRSNFPTHPITLVVQYPAGGGVDVPARLVSKYAEKYLGQNIVIVNQDGGGGVVGVTKVANAKPDGYTMGIMIPTVITDQYLVKGASYTPDSFDPVVQINSDYGVLSAQSGTKTANSLDADLAAAKAASQPYTVGMSGLWTTNDWALLSLKKSKDVPLTRVQFQGGAPAAKALLGGDINLSFNYPSEIADFVKTGKVTPLAVAAPDRLPSLPAVPTFTEAGYPDVATLGIWRILVVPKGTPEDVRAKLEDAFIKALKDPQLKKEAESVSTTIDYKSSADAAKVIAKDADTYKKLIDRYGLTVGSTP